MGLVERVEKAFPGTAYWHRHPIWRALDPEPICHEQLRFLYEGMPAEIRAALLYRHPGNRFWRRPSPWNRYLDLKGDNWSLDSAGAFACLVRDAEISQDQQLHSQALDALQKSLHGLENDQIISVGAYPLRALVANQWNGTVYFVVGKPHAIEYSMTDKKWVYRKGK